MYSQYSEDDVFLKFAPDHGRLLDIGAWSPITYSNSYALIQRGWEAVLVEPSPIPFASLMDAHRRNEKVILIHALVGLKWDVREFMCTPDTISTTERSNYEKMPMVDFRKIFVPEVPVNEIVQGQFGFISIDTEGTSVDILCALDLTATKTKLACVEYDDQKSRAEEHLNRHGLVVIVDNGTNLVAKAKE